jgi:nucleoside-diphosphate-sugar epimerase
MTPGAAPPIGDRPFPRKVLVTGAGGFIAGHLVPALADSGSDIVLLSRSPRRANGWSSDRVRWVQTDLRDESRLATILGEEAPDVVFHLAGTRGRGTPAPFLGCAEVNVSDTLRLLEAARRVAPATRFVLTGSAEEYGGHAGRQAEDLPLRPTSPYGLSKAAATRFALELAAQGGCPVVVLRLFSVYGPGQPPDMFVAEAVDCAVRGLPFRMSRGDQRRDLVFVADVVDALIRTARLPDVAGTVINVGTGEAHPLREVAERIWQLAASDGPLLVGAREASGAEAVDTWADIGRARALLGWEPRTGLDAGLRQTIEWARARLADPALEARAGGPSAARAAQCPR